MDATPACDKARADSRKKVIRSQAASQSPASTTSSGVYPCNGEILIPRSAARWNRYQTRKRRRPLIKIALSVDGLADLGTSPTEDEPVPDVEISIKRGNRSSSRPGDSVEEVPSNTSNGTSLSLTPPVAGAGWGFPFVPYSGSGPALVPLLIGHCRSLAFFSRL